jgi:hypothetical protein
MHSAMLAWFITATLVLIYIIATTLDSLISSWFTSSGVVAGGIVPGGVMMGGADRRRTCIFLSDYFQPWVAQRRLPGWRILPEYASHADFVYADGKYLQNKKINNIRATLKCRLDARTLFDKTAMHDALTIAAPETICASRPVSAGAILPAESVWILKANWGWSGKGNRIVTTQDELDAAIEYLSTPQQEFSFTRPEAVKIIASEYIRDPMLYRGYKFHLRLYVVIAVSDARHAVWIKNTGLIIPAAREYHDGDYENTLIHDTHSDSNPDMIGVWPRDLPTADPVRIMDMIKTAMTAMLPHIHKYPETKTGYDIYGVDVMLTRDGVPKLLEVNRFPGFLDNTDRPNESLDPTQWRFEILDAVLGSVANDVFGDISDSITSTVTRLI